VVLVTGWGASLDQDDVRSAGIAEVVQKPFDIDSVLETTARVLGAKAGRATPEEPHGADTPT
jgi:hypothetical protein